LPLHIIAVWPLPQVSVQLVQVHIDEPSQVTEQVPVQVTSQVEAPVQETLAPFSAVSVHLDSPVHVIMVPAPPVMLQVEPPPQVAVPLVPTDWSHVDCPSHDVVQPEPQVPVQVVLASQFEVQPDVQSTLQLFMCWQSRVTLEGAVDEPPPSPATDMPLSALKVSPMPPTLHV
jgi:hypothetical protein